MSSKSRGRKGTTTLRLYKNPAAATLRRIRRDTAGESDKGVSPRLAEEPEEPEQDHQFKWEDEVGASDMIKLDKLTVESLVNNLELRYAKDRIYTLVGSILVALNPYRSLGNGYYSAAIMSQYKNKRMGELPPHVFSLAEAAHRDLIDGDQSVSVIISGESGAGKTETCKLILSFISGKSAAPTEVEARIIESASILEAFGNAKTVRNKNSSRFGKLIKIRFDSGMKIVGGEIDTYLLELSRVTVQEEEERNYHIFYQVTEGCSKKERKKYKLERAEYYSLCNTCIDLNLDEKEELMTTKDGMVLFGFSKSDIDFVFRIISALLRLGNVQFGYDNKRERATISPESSDDLDVCCEMFQIEKSVFEKVLVVRKLKVRGTTIQKGLSGEEAASTRDAICRNVYSALFDWIVDRINTSLKPPKEADLCERSLGILDIFGFENFTVNSFEQLCINYANEKLHAQFLEHVFELEQREYDAEGIKFEKLSATDNSKCIALIEAKLGILTLLDEESKLQSGSDDSFLKKLINTHGKHPHLDKPRLDPNAFIVKHYAEAVTYATPGFRDKNSNVSPEDVLQMLQSSELAHMAVLFPAAAPVEEKSPRGGSSKKVAKSVSSVFKSQLITLKKTLDTTKPYFCRCIKPNEKQAPQAFQGEMVQGQLSYSGMVETVKIRAQGFPYRQPFDAFNFRYRALGVAGATQGEIKSFVKGHPSSADLRTGKTKVFMRGGAFDALEKERSEALRDVVIKLQAFARMVPARQSFVRTRDTVSFVNRNIRIWLKNQHTKRCIVAALCCTRMAEEMRQEQERIRKEEERIRKEKEEKERKRKEAKEKKLKLAKEKAEAEAKAAEEAKEAKRKKRQKERDKQKEAKASARQQEDLDRELQEELELAEWDAKETAEQEAQQAKARAAKKPQQRQSTSPRKSRQQSPRRAGAPPSYSTGDPAVEKQIAEINARIPPSDGYELIVFAKEMQKEVRGQVPRVADALYGRASEIYKRALKLFTMDSDLCINAGTCSINHANLRFIMPEYSVKSQGCLPLLDDAESMLEAALQVGKLDPEGAKAVQMRLAKCEELKQKALTLDIQQAGPQHKQSLKQEILDQLAAVPPVSKTGKMRKKGAGKAAGTLSFGRNNWTDRLFVLGANDIKYYAKSVKQEPKGSIALGKITAVKEHVTKGHDFTFIIACGDRLYHCSALSGDDMASWIQSIQTNVDRLKLEKKLAAIERM